jgi:hypothetical protein
VGPIASLDSVAKKNTIIVPVGNLILVVQSVAQSLYCLRYQFRHVKVSAFGVDDRLSIPGRANTFFSSVLYSYRLWGPSTLLLGFIVKR